jgi:SAM-dependent methyltransferase
MAVTRPGKAVMTVRTADPTPEKDWRARQAHVLPLLEGAASVLEVGCGQGRTLRLLAAPGRQVVGIDISAAHLLKAGEAGCNLDLVQGDAGKLPLTDAAFEAVLAAEVLEHVPDWQQALEELFRVARPRVVVTVPYRQRLKAFRCPHCHTRLPLYGHLHSFSPGSFAPWQDRGRHTVTTIGAPAGWGAYGRKARTWFRTNGRHAESGQQCTGCGALVTPGLRWQRAADRLWRLIAHTPEWILATWDLGPESDLAKGCGRHEQQ